MIFKSCPYSTKISKSLSKLPLAWIMNWGQSCRALYEESEARGGDRGWKAEGLSMGALLAVEFLVGLESVEESESSSSGTAPSCPCLDGHHAHLEVV
jgi:hypothetical protein